MVFVLASVDFKCVSYMSELGEEDVRFTLHGVYADSIGCLVAAVEDKQPL